jgi:hypothetical protein
MPGGLDVAQRRAVLPSLPSVSSVCVDVPRSLADIVDRLLHPVAAFRFPSARSLLDALDASGLCKTPTRFLDDTPPAPDEVRRATGGGGMRGGSADEAPRRRYVRTFYQTPLRVMSSTGAVVDGRSEDISAGGLLVIASGELPQGDRVVVRFALPTTGEVVQCSALVRWARHRAGTLRGRAAFGLEFTDASEAVVAAIERYTELMQREG